MLDEELLTISPLWGADDAPRTRKAETMRVSDRDDLIARFDLSGRFAIDVQAIRVVDSSFYNGQIDTRVIVNDHAFRCRIVRKADIHKRGTFHDVLIRDDQAVFPDQKTAAQTFGMLDEYNLRHATRNYTLPSIRRRGGAPG